MVSLRDGVIAELRDEAYTLLAFGWLAFRHRDAKAFPSLDFNFQVLDPDEKEVEEFVSKDEADPGVFSDTPSSVPLPSEAKVPVKAGSLFSPAGASRLLTCMARRLALLRLLVTLPRTFRPLCILFAHFG